MGTYLQRRHHPLPLVPLLGHQALALIQVLPNLLLNLHHLLPVISIRLVLGIYSVPLKTQLRQIKEEGNFCFDSPCLLFNLSLLPATALDFIPGSPFAAPKYPDVGLQTTISKYNCTLMVERKSKT